MPEIDQGHQAWCIVIIAEARLLLGVEPADRHSPEELVRRIDPPAGFRPRMSRGLPVGCRSDNQSLQLLETPAALDEPIGQPVEQFGVRRPATQAPKVARRLDNPPSKVILPNAVEPPLRLQ